MSKTFCPNSAVHMTSCFLPHHVSISCIWQFYYYISHFCCLASLTSQLSPYFSDHPAYSFTLHFSHNWPRLKSVAKIPLICLQRDPLGTWECHSPSLPPLPSSLGTESCQLCVGWETRKGRVSFPPLPSTLLSPFPDTHSCWIIIADSCALVCSWIQLNPLRKQPEKRKEGGEGKP